MFKFRAHTQAQPLKRLSVPISPVHSVLLPRVNFMFLTPHNYVLSHFNERVYLCCLTMPESCTNEWKFEKTKFFFKIIPQNTRNKCWTVDLAFHWCMVPKGGILFELDRLNCALLRELELVLFTPVSFLVDATMYTIARRLPNSVYDNMNCLFFKKIQLRIFSQTRISVLLPNKHTCVCVNHRD